MLRTLLGVGTALLANGLLDELTTGVPVSAAGLIQSQLGLSASLLTFALFTVPVGIAIVIEPPLFLWAAKKPRMRVVSVALLVVALGAVLLACARSSLGLMLALSIWYPAIGLAAGLAQAELMDRAPAQRERNLTRWTLLAAIGDIAAPALLAASVTLELGYRGALCAAAALCVLLSLRLWFIAPAHASEDEEETKTSRLGEIVRNRPLLVWLFASALCDLMDETLAALAAVRVEHDLNNDPRALLWVLGAVPLGGSIALLALERALLRFRAISILAWSCLASLLAMTLFLTSQSIERMALSALLLGAVNAVHYPLAQAQAYRAAPDDSAWVATLGSAFTALTVLSTPLLGLVVDRCGLTWGFVTLCAQPLGLLLIVAATHRHANNRV